MPRRLTDHNYGKEELDSDLETLSAGAPTIEDVWKITERLPLLITFNETYQKILVEENKK